MGKEKQIPGSESADRTQSKLRQEAIYQIRKYLSTAIFDGVGPIIAARVATRFGIETVSVIEVVPNRLNEVSGVGEKRKQAIVQGWATQTRIKQAVSLMTAPRRRTGGRSPRKKKLLAKGKMRKRCTSIKKKVT